MPDPIDIHVGSRVRLRRTLMGLSQQSLGQALSLTFQQIQKYERGTNRIGAGRLMRIASALDVHPSYFFDDMPEEIAGKGAARNHGAVPDLNYARRETHELVRVFSRIDSNDVRGQLLALMRVLGAVDTN